MGMIHITFSGSFKFRSGATYVKTFSAQEGGHARAIANAIHWLSNCVPEAVEQDHSLHEERQFPEDKFGLLLKKQG